MTSATRRCDDRQGGRRHAARGKTEHLWPPDSEPAPIGAEETVLVPSKGSIRLDEKAGAERVQVVFSSAPSANPPAAPAPAGPGSAVAPGKIRQIRLRDLAIDGQAVRLFRASDGKELGRDTEYAGDSYGVDFDRAGRLVATCFDGFLRLYDPELMLIAKVKLQGGKEPFGVRFSSVGKIAVGYNDSPRVEVLSAVDLTHLYSPDTGDLHSSGLSAVAWSADGRALYAAGHLSRNGDHLILSWSDAGRGERSELATGGRDTINCLQQLPGGRLAFGSLDPAWGVLSASGALAVFTGPKIAEFRAMGEGLRLDSTAVTVRFSFQPRGAEPATFQVQERALKLHAAEDRSSSPRLEAPGLAITDWRNSGAPARTLRTSRSGSRVLSRALRSAS